MSKQSMENDSELQLIVKGSVLYRLRRHLLDFIILRFLNGQPMHGYNIIMKIRRSFDVYFSTSTVYPLLAALEKKGFVRSYWNMTGKRPRRMYKITAEGQSMLSSTEDFLRSLCNVQTCRHPKYKFLLNYQELGK